MSDLQRKGHVKLTHWQRRQLQVPADRTEAVFRLVMAMKNRIGNRERDVTKGGVGGSKTD